MDIFGIFRKKSPAPEVPTSPAAGVSVSYGYGGGSIADIVNSGKINTVSTPDAALKLTEFYSSINKISNTVSTLSRNFYRNSTRLNIEDYNLVYLFKKMMAPGLVPSKCLKTWVFNYLAGGNGYLIINRDKVSGEAVTFINRKWYEIIPFLDGGGRVWFYDAKNKHVYNWFDVLHLADLTDDAVMGKTKVSHQADSLGKSAAINEFTNKYFSKGLFLGAVIQYPVGSGISQEDAGALENTMRQVYGGVDKSGQVAVLTEGGELKQLKTDIPLGDTKYIESEAMTKRDIRAMFGIPDDMTTEAGVTEYYQNAIMPIIRQIEEEINAKVINPLDQKEIYFKFEVDSTLRADVRTRADVLEKYLRNSLMTINEGRTLLNLAPIEGGDVPMVMANNMVPLQQLEDFVNSKIN